MKRIIILIVVICITSCKQKGNKASQSTKIVADSTSNQLKVDSLGNPVFTYEGQDDGEIIIADTFQLKNNYTLIIFPTREEIDYLNYRLIGGGRDTIFYKIGIQSQNYMSWYDDKVDSKNYFILQYTLGTHNRYIRLYDKRTGKSVFNEYLFTILGDYNVANELLLYVDEDDKYNTYIYDLNTKSKTLVDIPITFLNKQECTKYNNSLKTMYIKRVTPKYYYLGFGICDSIVEYKIKRPN